MSALSSRFKPAARMMIFTLKMLFLCRKRPGVAAVARRNEDYCRTPEKAPKKNNECKANTIHIFRILSK